MGKVKSSTEVQNSTEQLLNAPYGMQGAQIISETTAQYGNWYCIIAIADDTTLKLDETDVNWIEQGTWANNSGIPNLDLITGLPYYGDFKKIKLVDGKVIAYNKG